MDLVLYELTQFDNDAQNGTSITSYKVFAPSKIDAMLYFLKESITQEDFYDLEDEGNDTEDLFSRLCSLPESDIEYLFENHFPTEMDIQYYKFQSYNVPQVNNIYIGGK